MVKNNINLAGERKQQCPFFRTYASKNARIPPMSRIGPGDMFSVEMR